MARVSISVNGHSYDIACGDGQEQHIVNLAQDLERRVAELVGTMGHAGQSAGQSAGEARLLAMAGLLMADELAEAREEIQTLRAAVQRAEDAPSARSATDENGLACILESMAEKIETIAQKAEQP